MKEGRQERKKERKEGRRRKVLRQNILSDEMIHMAIFRRERNLIPQRLSTQVTWSRGTNIFLDKLSSSTVDHVLNPFSPETLVSQKLEWKVHD
jgi:hypothetical protein